jgi:hypothetical protein
MSVCTWNIACTEPARHQVDCQTRPGLILDEQVCDGHLEDARSLGYLLRGPIEASDTRPGVS